MTTNRRAGVRGHGRRSTLPQPRLWAYARRRADRLPFPLDEPGCRLFARARHCVWQGVQALGLWLRLWFLEVDGKPVGAKYNFRFAGVEFSYQAGRDPSWDRFSIGLVILAHAMREALADGVQEYRFLRGGEKYKYHLNEDPGLETIPLARRPLGQAALTAHFLLGDRVAFFCPAPAARLVTRFRVGETQDPGERNGTPAGAYG